MSTSKSGADRNAKLMEISLYRKNDTAYHLVLWAVVAELVYVIQVLGNMEINVLIGATTMLNIVILFTLFTIAIKVNVYSELFTKIGYGVVVYLGIRLGLLLPMVIRPTGALGVIYGSTIATLGFLLAGCMASTKKMNIRNQARGGANK